MPRELKGIREIMRINLRRIRNIIGLSQTKLDDALGMYRNSIMAMENGHRPVSLGIIIDITEKFDVDPREFFWRDDVKDTMTGDKPKRELIDIYNNIGDEHRRKLLEYGRDMLTNYKIISGGNTAEREWTIFYIPCVT